MLMPLLIFCLFFHEKSLHFLSPSSFNAEKEEKKKHNQNDNERLFFIVKILEREIHGKEIETGNLDTDIYFHGA